MNAAAAAAARLAEALSSSEGARALVLGFAASVVGFRVLPPGSGGGGSAGSERESAGVGGGGGSGGGERRGAASSLRRGGQCSTALTWSCPSMGAG